MLQGFQDQDTDKKCLAQKSAGAKYFSKGQKNLGA
jgi:hypothetical protein